MIKKTTLFAITMTAIMPLTFAQAKPIKAEETNVPENTTKKPQDVLDRQAAIEDKKDARQELISQRKDALAQKKCETAQKRISTKAGQLQNNRAMYQRVYGNMEMRLERLTQRLGEAGLDTEKLSSDLSTLQKMTDDLYTNYDSFIMEFQNTKTAACEKTKEEFQTQFQGIRDQVAQIKTQRSAIKDYFNSTIKPELERLRAQLGKELGETTRTRTNPEGSLEETAVEPIESIQN